MTPQQIDALRTQAARDTGDAFVPQVPRRKMIDFIVTARCVVGTPPSGRSLIPMRKAYENRSRWPTPELRRLYRRMVIAFVPDGIARAAGSTAKWIR